MRRWRVAWASRTGWTSGWTGSPTGSRSGRPSLRAILHAPPVLLADEPESGLDPEALAALGETLAREGERRRTVVMTTHNLEQGLALGNRVAVLAHGRIAYQERSADADVALLRQMYHAPVGVAR